MFREMRRKKQALSNEENLAILMRGTSGVMAVSGDDDYPYAVPLSYVYHDSKIYFHCAASGHKLDAMRRNPIFEASLYSVQYGFWKKNKIRSPHLNYWQQSILLI